MDLRHGAGCAGALMREHRCLRERSYRAVLDGRPCAGSTRWRCSVGPGSAEQGVCARLVKFTALRTEKDIGRRERHGGQ